MSEFLRNFLGNDILAFFISAALPLFLFVVPFALFAVLAERKVSAFMQDRIGPNRVGPKGLLQTVADIIKMMQKEDSIPSAADRKLFILAPYLVFIGSFAGFAALPFSSFYIGSSINLGVFYIIAVSSLSVVGILMGGWASNNKYSLYGAMRSVSQIVSYEIPALLSIIAVVMVIGKLNLHEIAEMQTSSFFNWYIFGGPIEGLQKYLLIPFMVVAFIIFFIASLAEVNRTPFDIPEAEAELVAGYYTEYTPMKFAMFFLAEYASMFLVAAISVSLFFGGWQSPFGYLGNSLEIKWLIPIEQLLWFLSKGLFLVFVQMWLRWTLPRLRVDQLMNLCWKYLIPYAFLNLIIIGIITLI
ncbi:MAG: NADH-quinone oxidoreductase subunit NuoH [Ignavibacteria bacterium]|nr:NADH-quinone oxidoreductase subunit NuoH [Ignavibacteria bacterium]